MKKHNYSGLFIAIEGLDGSGSSTQVDLLVKNLNKLGFYTYGTKEPTNNLIGGLIRGALTHDWKAAPECLQLLFAADRSHHLDREIIPGLAKGNISVTDRYFFSTIAFGSIDLEREWLIGINDQFISPDLAIFIKVPPRECIRRISKSRNQFELFEEERKLKKVWQTYEDLASDKRWNAIIIDGTKSIAQIEEEIMLHIKPLVGKKRSLGRRETNLFSLDEEK